MRCYPIFKSPRFFVEEIPGWEKKWSCADEWNQYYRRKHNKSNPVTVYYPVIDIDPILNQRLRQYCANRCSAFPGKTKNSTDFWVHEKNYPKPSTPVRNIYREYNLDRDFKIVKNSDLYFDKWEKNRRKPVFKVRLPTKYRGARYNKISMGPPNGFTDLPQPINIREVRRKKHVVHTVEKKGKGKDKKGKKGKKGKK